MNHKALLMQFEYMNHMNPHTFEVEDLDKLIKSVGMFIHTLQRDAMFKMTTQWFLKPPCSEHMVHGPKWYQGPYSKREFKSSHADNGLTAEMFAL